MAKERKLKRVSVPFRPVWVIAWVIDPSLQPISPAWLTVERELQEVRDRVTAHGGELVVVAVASDALMANVRVTLECLDVACVDEIQWVSEAKNADLPTEPWLLNRPKAGSVLRLLECVDGVVLWGFADDKIRPGKLTPGDPLEVAMRQKLSLLQLRADGRRRMIERFLALGTISDEKIEWLTRKGFIHSPRPEEATQSADELTETFKANFSDEAGVVARSFRNLTAWVVGLSTFSVVVGGLAAGWTPNVDGNFGISGQLGLTELVLVVMLFVLKWTAQSGEGQREWIETRFGAELCRGMRHSYEVIESWRPIFGTHRPAWRRVALTASVMFSRRKRENKDSAEWCATYLKMRLDLQIKYFRTNWQKARLKSLGFRSVAMFSFMAALVLTVGVFIERQLHGVLFTTTWEGRLIVLAAIALPVAGAALMALSRVLDYDRRAVRYRDMADRLEQLAREAPAGESWERVTEWVERTEELLAEEHMEWHFTTRLADLW